MRDIIVINLSPPDPITCAMCEAEGYFEHAVPYYCGPVLEGHSEGGYRSVCGPCYARWEAWSNRITEERAASARLNWDEWKPLKDTA